MAGHSKMGRRNKRIFERVAKRSGNIALGPRESLPNDRRMRLMMGFRCDTVADHRRRTPAGRKPTTTVRQCFGAVWLRHRLSKSC